MKFTKLADNFTINKLNRAKIKLKARVNSLEKELEVKIKMNDSLTSKVNSLSELKLPMTIY